jgi:hypothetical protein
MSNASEEGETRSRSTSLLVNNVVNTCIEDDEEVDGEVMHGPEIDPYLQFGEYPEMYYSPYVAGFDSEYEMAKD